MNRLKSLSCAVLVLALSNSTLARDTLHYYSIQEALNSPDAAKVLDKNIKLYFNHGVDGEVVGKNLVTNRKTSAFAKSDEKACRWAFLSGVKSLQARAKKMKASKVANIHSFHKKTPYYSSTKYECHAGAMIARVALRGDMVK